MLIKNDKDFAEYLHTTPDKLASHFTYEYVDYHTEIESDGYSVIIRMCDEELPSIARVMAYPFDSRDFDDVLSSQQCYADYMNHEGKGKHGNYDSICVDYDVPPLLEDEIAEILEKYAGKEVYIIKCPSVVERFRYMNYNNSKDIVFKIYDALRHHYLVTVDNKNIIDL